MLATLARLLLLLARLRLAAALLLAGLLTRVLVLLARVLVWIAHSGSPLLNAACTNPATADWLLGNRVPRTILMWRRIVATETPEPALETILYKPIG
jgi:hypothetical protein